MDSQPVTKQLIRDLRDISITNPKPDVLIIEDNEFDANQLSKSIKQIGGEVVHLSSGELVEEIIDNKKFDIVFLDLRLAGGLSGVDVLLKIRKRGILTPVVLVSGQIDPTILEVGKQVGYIGFIEKPISDSDVQEIFTKHKLQ